MCGVPFERSIAIGTVRPGAGQGHVGEWYPVWTEVRVLMSPIPMMVQWDGRAPVPRLRCGDGDRA
ncbi:hypothetical protein BH24CHL4_BH24CHL4_27490 [soil metagenome]